MASLVRLRRPALPLVGACWVLLACATGHASQIVLKPSDIPVVILPGESVGDVEVRIELAGEQEIRAGQGTPPRVLIYDRYGRLVYSAPVRGDGTVIWKPKPALRRRTLGPFWIRVVRAGAGPSPATPGAGLFVDVSGRALPPDSSWARCVALGDLDGDGDLDVVLGHNRTSAPMQPQVLINDGRGYFRDETQQRLPELRMLVTDVELVDVEPDGDLDIFLADQESSPRLLINDGAGHFTDESETRLPDADLGLSCFAFGDFDGERDLDLVAVANDLEQDSLTVYFFINKYGGHFPDSLARTVRIENRMVTDIAPADIDGDGDLDLILGCMPVRVVLGGMPPRLILLPGTNAVLVNDGFHFRDESHQRFQAALPSTTGRILPGDVDGDGDVDLFCVNFGFYALEATNRLWINDGTGVFVDKTLTHLPPERILWNNGGTQADFNGDGALDFFLPSVKPDSGGYAPDLLYINDGTGHFADRSDTDLPALLDFSTDAAAGDVDQDGDTDLFVANSPPSIDDTTLAVNRLYENTTVGTGIRQLNTGTHPAQFTLDPPHPNPFNSTVVIRYVLPEATVIDLAVYDARGRLVRTLAAGRQSAGEWNLRWDGTDATGQILPTGIYLIVLRAGDFRAVRKAVFVR